MASIKRLYAANNTKPQDGPNPFDVGNRITETGDDRVTEDGDTRVTENTP